jgi:hypothetical protein
MTDDLVKRLREMCGDDGILAMRDIYDTDVAAAAARIEELEEALGALWWGVGENGAPDELLEKTKDALKGTKYD